MSSFTHYARLLFPHQEKHMSPVFISPQQARAKVDQQLDGLEHRLNYLSAVQATWEYRRASDQACAPKTTAGGNT